MIDFWGVLQKDKVIEFEKKCQHGRQLFCGQEAKGQGSVNSGGEAAGAVTEPSTVS